MNKKLIVFLVVCIVVLLGAATGITFAWLTSTGSATINYKVGEVAYTVKGNVASETVIVPGQNLSNSFTITNNSNVNTNLRITISVSDSTWTFKEVDTTGNPNTTNHVLLSMANSKWKSYSENGIMYFYYGQKENTANGAGIEDILPSTKTIEFPFSDFKLNGYVVGNESKNKSITFTITFYAKQADHVTWDEMGSISFQTGLPNNTQA